MLFFPFFLFPNLSNRTAVVHVATERKKSVPWQKPLDERQVFTTGRGKKKIVYCSLTVPTLWFRFYSTDDVLVRTCLRLHKDFLAAVEQTATQMATCLRELPLGFVRVEKGLKKNVTIKANRIFKKKEKGHYSCRISLISEYRGKNTVRGCLGQSYLGDVGLGGQSDHDVQFLQLDVDGIIVLDKEHFDLLLQDLRPGKENKINHVWFWFLCSIKPDSKSFKQDDSPECEIIYLQTWV